MMLALQESTIRVELTNVKTEERITTIQFGDMLAEMLGICQMNVRVSKIIQVIYNINCCKKRIEEVVMTMDSKTVTLAQFSIKIEIMDVLNTIVHTDMDSEQAVNQ